MGQGGRSLWSRVGWSLFLLPSWGLLGVFLAQPRMFHLSALRYVLDAENVVPHVVGAVGIGAIVFGILRRRPSRPRRIVAVATLLLTLATMLAIASFRAPWVRYQLLRFETLHAGLGITDWKRARRVELVDELLYDRIGPLIASDEALLRELVLHHGDAFQDHPRAAQLAYAGLQALGATFDELAPAGDAFLGAVLNAETRPEAWADLDAYPRPLLEPRPDHGLHAGLLTPDQARQVVDRVRLSDGPDAQEQLVYYALFLPHLFSDDEREDLLRRWTRRFPEMTDQAEAGLELRDTFRSLARRDEPVHISISAEADPHLAPRAWRHEAMEPTLRHMLRGLVGSLPDVHLVPPAEADLRVQAMATVQHSFDRTVPVYETREERVRSRSLPSGRHPSQTFTRTVSRTEVVGTRSEAELDASVTIHIDGPDGAVDLDERLFYWYDIVVAREKHRAEPRADVDWSALHQTFGERVWPLGLRETLFRLDAPHPEGRH